MFSPYFGYVWSYLPSAAYAITLLVVCVIYARKRRSFDFALMALGQLAFLLGQVSSLAIMKSLDGGDSAAREIMVSLSGVSRFLYTAGYVLFAFGFIRMLIRKEPEFRSVERRGNLEISTQGESVSIRGDADGLRGLATELLFLASLSTETLRNMPDKEGYRASLQPERELSKNSVITELHRV